MRYLPACSLRGLALFSLIVISVVAGLAKLTPLVPNWAGLLLLVECLGLLAESFMRAVRHG